ncbi:hypothetical protein [Haloferax larsenii]|nr:hypothetical protein [Haloferax larsenii]
MEYADFKDLVLDVQTYMIQNDIKKDSWKCLKTEFTPASITYKIRILDAYIDSGKQTYPDPPRNVVGF